MSRALLLQAGRQSWPIELNDSATAAELRDALRFGLGGPLLAWGGMRYFGISWKWGVEVPRTQLEYADLAYWDVGAALCIFLGPTPRNHAEQPPFVAPSAMTLVGKVDGELEKLAALPPGTRIKINDQSA